MNKDALLATGIGFLLGIIITGLILFGPKLASRLPKVNFPKIGFSFNLPSFGGKQQNTTAPQQKNAPTNLTITSPLPEALAESDPLLVSGTAPIGSTIVIGGEIDEDIVVATETGSFAGKIIMREGKNSILITALNGNNIFEQNITVYYTPEKF